MEIILKETINSLGREGDIVKVKAGYGRNFLLPKGKAVAANAANIALFEKNKAVIAARLEKERKQAEAVSKKLAGISIEIKQLVGEDERLFGSVTSTDICEKLADLGIEIDKKQIVLPNPIKTLGETNVPVKVGFEITTDILVKVVAQDKE
ncbi:MAG: 50S ribosomal protein L9 [Desulfopila sp.]|jgi:large subunit ribosomal protein L9|nr:50S ribosomal protein L9 [Desulfopila sp.]